MSTQVVSPLRRRMIEDMNVYLLGTNALGAGKLAPLCCRVLRGPLSRGTDR